LSRSLVVLLNPLLLALCPLPVLWSVVSGLVVPAYRPCLWLPEVIRLSKRTCLTVSSGMQTLTLSSNGKNGQLLDSKMSARLRAFRFLSDRFAQRDRPSYAVEFILFVLIVLTATYSMFTLAHAMSSLAHTMSLNR
jgi:hypothetical protein